MAFEYAHILSMRVPGHSWDLVIVIGWIDRWVDGWKSDFCGFIPIFRNKIFQMVEFLIFNLPYNCLMLLVTAAFLCSEHR